MTCFLLYKRKLKLQCLPYYCNCCTIILKVICISIKFILLVTMFNTQQLLLFKQIKFHLRRLAFHMRLFNFLSLHNFSMYSPDNISNTRRFVGFNLHTFIYTYLLRHYYGDCVLKMYLLYALLSVVLNKIAIKIAGCRKLF